MADIRDAGSIRFAAYAGAARPGCVDRDKRPSGGLAGAARTHRPPHRTHAGRIEAKDLSRPGDPLKKRRGLTKSSETVCTIRLWKFVENGSEWVFSIR